MSIDLEPGLPVPVPVPTAVALGERGDTEVRMMAGPSDADGIPVVLLHGLTASAGMNWVHAFGPMSEDRPVIAPDHRGHAGGPLFRRGDRIETLADDVVALLDTLAIDTATIVGFSMGGAVAQVVARRHPERVHSLVLVSTSSRFRMGPIGARTYGLNAIGADLAGLVPDRVRARLLRRLMPDPDPVVREFLWHETRRHTARGLARVGAALRHFHSTKWLGELRVPTSVVVASEDKSIHPDKQRQLLDLIPGAHGFEVATGHAGVIWESERALPVLRTAIAHADGRAATGAV